MIHFLTTLLRRFTSPPQRQTVYLDPDLGDFVDEPPIQPLSELDQWRLFHELGEPISRDESQWWADQLRVEGNCDA